MATKINETRDVHEALSHYFQFIEPFLMQQFDGNEPIQRVLESIRNASTTMKDMTQATRQVVEAQLLRKVATFVIKYLQPLADAEIQDLDEYYGNGVQKWDAPSFESHHMQSQGRDEHAPLFIRAQAYFLALDHAQRVRRYIETTAATTKALSELDAALAELDALNQPQPEPAAVLQPVISSNGHEPQPA
ncbi:MAG TPA: hypothetical protein VLI92_02810 [Candidatus Saccharimonadales bacterium]|nr:hypothetical protein [Candidatus Saccharimonadales bacterium]